MKGFLKRLVTGLAAFGMVFLINQEFQKAQRAGLLNLFSLEGLTPNRQKMEAKAMSTTLNQLIPSFEYLQNFQEKKAAFDAPEFSKYIDYFEKVVEYYPDTAEGYGFLGYLYFYKGEETKAMDFFQKSLTLDRKNFWFFYDLGLIYFKNRQYPQASSAWQQALSLPAQETFKTILHSRLYFQVLGRREDHYQAVMSDLTDAYAKAYQFLKLSELYGQGRLKNPLNIPPDLRIY